MSQADNPTPASVSDPVDSPRNEAPPGGPGSPVVAAVSQDSGRTWLIVLEGGLLAGIAGFGLGEYTIGLVAPSLELPPGIRGDQTLAPLEHARRVQESQDRSAILGYGALGAIVGLVLGGAGGLAHRSPRAVAIAGLTGLVLGGAATTGITALILPWYHGFYATPSDENATQQLGLALATHGGMWAAIGVTAGLALGLGLGEGRVARAIFGGILGSILAAVIYEFVGAVAFPLDKTFRPVALASAPRLIAHVIVAVSVSAGALWAAYHLSLRRSPASSGS